MCISWVKPIQQINVKQEQNQICRKMILSTNSDGSYNNAIMWEVGIKFAYNKTMNNFQI